MNNMDHMRISGTEHSSAILSQKKYFQNLIRDVQNVPKQAEAKVYFGKTVAWKHRCDTSLQKPWSQKVNSLLWQTFYCIWVL